MSRAAEELVDELIPAFRLMLLETAQRAFQAGRAESAREFRQKIAAALSDDQAGAGWSVQSASNADTVADRQSSVLASLFVSRPPDSNERAAPGTVKPLIERFVQSAPWGITTEEITQQTGVKHNSVRGTLHTLKNENKVERRGDRWFPVFQTNEAADNVSVGGTSAASEQEPGAQGGEARPGGGT